MREAGANKISAYGRECFGLESKSFRADRKNDVEWIILGFTTAKHWAGEGGLGCKVCPGRKGKWQQLIMEQKSFGLILSL